MKCRNLKENQITIRIHEMETVCLEDAVLPLSWNVSDPQIAEAEDGYFFEGKNPGAVITGIHPGNTVLTVTDASGSQISFFIAVKAAADERTVLRYRTYAEGERWLPWVSAGEFSGTKGQGKMLEGIRIELPEKEYPGGVEYRVCKGEYGWEDYWSPNGETAGNTAGVRIEAVQIRLTGRMADHFDICYRVYAQKFGWLGWAKNGESAGTDGFHFRAEGIQILLNEKGNAFVCADEKIPYLRKDDIHVLYCAKRSGEWTEEIRDPQLCGSIREKIYLQGICIRLSNPQFGTVRYQTYCAGTWEEGWAENGEPAGDCGIHLEAIRIQIYGKITEIYDIWYSVYVKKNGWLDWAKNGEEAGTRGWGRPVQGYRICLTPKGTVPGKTARPYLEKTEKRFGFLR